jgi:hypothetical protein
MREVWIGSTRTGNLIEKVEATDDTTMNVTILGDDRSETIIPLHKINTIYTKNLETYLKTDERFLVAFKTGTTAGPADFAGPIENFTVSNDRSDVTVNSVGMGIWVENLLVLPPANRSRIDSEETVWTVTGTPAQIVTQVLVAATTEAGNYRFPQSINPPTGGGSTVITHEFKLSELPTVKDLIDELNQSYEGFETVFVPRIVDGSPRKVVWDTFVGNPHYNKDLEPLSVNINQRDGVTGFSYGKNGAEKANWWFARSQATDPANDTWIDLKSVVKSVPAGDEEHLTLFNKEFFDVALTDVELSSQLSARMSQADVEMKTFTINVFDKDFNYLTKLGRRLQVTATKRLAGLDEMLRITGVSWKLNDTSSVQLTVQPAALRVYPRVPNRLSDLVKDQVRDAIKEAGWKPPAGLKPEKAETPPLNIGDWDNPGVIDKTYPTDMEKSPLTDWRTSLNEVVNRTGGGQSSGNDLTSALWGPPSGLGGYVWENTGPDSSTTIPHNNQRRFYGLSWSALTTMAGEEPQLAPWKLEVFKSRKFMSFPTFLPDQVGNYPHATDENHGLSGEGGKIGELTSEQISAQMLPAVGPNNYELKWERLANGAFIRGVGDDEYYVIYIHQLQLLTGEQSWIKSKGFAFERRINQENGDFIGDWIVTDYPFDVSDSSQTYYPWTAQVESYGPERSVVTCITPAAYFKDKRVPASYPLIISNTYWTKIRMGRFAIEDCSITKNYRTDEVFKTSGMGISIFQTKNETEEKWSEPYQLLAHGGELWASNMAATSYYSNVATGDQYYGSKFSMGFSFKAKVDKDGKPTGWNLLAAQYFSGEPQSWNSIDDSQVFVKGLSAFRNYVFINHAWEADMTNKTSAFIGMVGGKVGVEEAKILTGLTPTLTSSTFTMSSSASGFTAKPKQFFPDFYDFSKVDDNPNNANFTKWMKKGNDYIIPIWNGNRNDTSSNEALHGMSSLKAMNLGEFIVFPSETASYLLGSDGGGNGVYTYYR